MKQLHPQHGATLVEVLVAIALAGIVLPTFAQAALISQKARPLAAQRLQAASLEREAFEALRVIREAGWSNVSADGTYHPAITGSSWTLDAGAETLGPLSRQIEISSVARDGSGAIVASGGTTDPSTKHIVITVSWSTPASGTVSGETYLTRWQSNTAWVQTTQADFSGGTLSNTTATGSDSVELTSPSTAPSGTFESSTFDAGSEVSFNSLSFSATVPGDAELKFQVAANNSGSAWTYVGPDGTGGTYFTAAQPIPLTVATARYLRYKAFFAATSDGLQTPALLDITINYSL